MISRGVAGRVKGWDRPDSSCLSPLSQIRPKRTRPNGTRSRSGPPESEDARFGLAAVAVLAACLALATGASAQVTIDDFGAAQGPQTATAGTSSVSTVAEGGSAVVGAFRDLVAMRAAGTGTTSVEVTASTVVFSSDAGADGSARLAYDDDGDGDPSAVAAAGLTPTDLTAGGHDALLLTVEAAAGGPTLRVQVWSGDDLTSSSFSVGLPDLAAATPYAIPYALFTQTVGATAAANFATVTAIAITLEGNDVSATLSGPIQTGVATPQISVTKVDLDDFSIAGGTEIGGGFVDLGDSLTYQITVRNTGADGTAVTIADMLDPNLMQSLPEDVRISPLAFPDLYDDLCGNTRLLVDGSPGFEGLLSNDLDLDDSPPGNSNLTLTMIQGMAVPGGPYPTAQGGSVTNVNPASGTFEYDPPPGFRGTDTFAYTVSDDEGQSARGLATLVVPNIVWWVESGHPGAALGTQNDPFTTLAPLDGAGGSGDQDSPGDTILVLPGTGYTTGLELEADQALLGRSSMMLPCGIAAAGPRPTLGNTVGSGVTLGSGNTLDEIDVSSTGGAGIVGSAIGALTVSNVAVTSATGAVLDLVNGTLDATFDALSSTNAPAVGVDLDSLSGSLLVNNTTNISGATGFGVRVTNSAAAGFDFGQTTINAAGGIDVGTGNVGALFTFDTLSVTATAGSGLVANNSGTVNINSTAATVDTTGGPAVNIVNTTGQTHGSSATGWTFASLSSSGSTTIGVDLENMPNDFTVTGATTITNAADDGVEITGAGAATTDIAFGATTVTGGGVTDIGVQLGSATPITGTISFASITTTNTQFQGVFVQNVASTTVTGAVSVTASGSQGVFLAASTGTTSFGSLTVDNSANNQTCLFGSGAGTFIVNASNGVLGGFAQRR